VLVVPYSPAVYWKYSFSYLSAVSVSSLHALYSSVFAEVGIVECVVFCGLCASLCRVESRKECSGERRGVVRLPSSISLISDWFVEQRWLYSLSAVRRSIGAGTFTRFQRNVSKIQIMDKMVEMETTFDLADLNYNLQEELKQEVLYKALGLEPPERDLEQDEEPEPDLYQAPAKRGPGRPKKT